MCNLLAVVRRLVNNILGLEQQSLPDITESCFRSISNWKNLRFSSVIKATKNLKTQEFGIQLSVILKRWEYGQLLFMKRNLFYRIFSLDGDWNGSDQFTKIPQFSKEMLQDNIPIVHHRTSQVTDILFAALKLCLRIAHLLHFRFVFDLRLRQFFSNQVNY